jgi:hypothetical protein
MNVRMNEYFAKTGIYSKPFFPESVYVLSKYRFSKQAILSFLYSFNLSLK